MVLIDLLAFLVRVKVLRPNVISKHDIIIEIDEVIGQAWDVVQMTLNGRRAVRGQVREVLKNFLGDESKSGKCNVTVRNTILPWQ